jgi:hypothetical protein
MSEPDNSNEDSGRADRSGDDPFERLRKYLDEIRPEWEASRERSKRALAEMEIALKLSSR